MKIFNRINKIFAAVAIGATVLAGTATADLVVSFGEEWQSAGQDVWSTTIQLSTSSETVEEVLHGLQLGGAGYVGLQGGTIHNVDFDVPLLNSGWDTMWNSDNGAIIAINILNQPLTIDSDPITFLYIEVQAEHGAYIDVQDILAIGSGGSLIPVINHLSSTIPAPGALALLGLAGISTRRRRR